MCNKAGAAARSLPCPQTDNLHIAHEALLTHRLWAQESGDGMAWHQTTAADGSVCLELKITDPGQPWVYSDR